MEVFRVSLIFAVVAGLLSLLWGFVTTLWDLVQAFWDCCYQRAKATDSMQYPAPRIIRSAELLDIWEYRGYRAEFYHSHRDSPWVDFGGNSASGSLRRELDSAVEDAIKREKVEELWE